MGLIREKSSGIIRIFENVFKKVIVRFEKG